MPHIDKMSSKNLVHSLPGREFGEQDRNQIVASTHEFRPGHVEILHHLMDRRQIPIEPQRYANTARRRFERCQCGMRKMNNGGVRTVAPALRQNCIDMRATKEPHDFFRAVPKHKIDISEIGKVLRQFPFNADDTNRMCAPVVAGRQIEYEGLSFLAEQRLGARRRTWFWQRTRSVSHLHEQFRKLLQLPFHARHARCYRFLGGSQRCLESGQPHAGIGLMSEPRRRKASTYYRPSRATPLGQHLLQSGERQAFRRHFLGTTNLIKNLNTRYALTQPIDVVLESNRVWLTPQERQICEPNEFGIHIIEQILNIRYHLNSTTEDVIYHDNSIILNSLSHENHHRQQGKNRLKFKYYRSTSLNKTTSQ